jgi:hypothetical protein
MKGETVTVDGMKGEDDIMTRRIAVAIALVAALATATGAYADYTPSGDTQAPRGQDSQSPRG